MAQEKNPTISLIIPSELLEAVDRKAAKLDINRSQYFRKLARQDVEQHAAVKIEKGSRK
jgi:metal-responsive CopG/Arc/MetJ family transcriptional regulator